eukprot:7776954-Alexandrium_andersonii.AAC.1
MVGIYRTFASSGMQGIGTLAERALNLVLEALQRRQCRFGMLKPVSLARRGGACGRGPPAWPLGAPGCGMLPWPPLPTHHVRAPGSMHATGS